MGGFIEPDRELETLDDPNEKLKIEIYSGYKAMNHAKSLTGQNRFFDEIYERARGLPLPYEDQCTDQYYFDLVQTLRDFAGEYGRVVEVGVYMGGASSVLAGCAERFDFDLDLVDISEPFLLYSYERIRRLFPEAAKRVRLFHGDVPSYVATVLTELPEGAPKHLIHHDGAHDFNQVVRDLAALSFARDKIHSIIAQDTHLRGTLEHMNFVDMALYAVFGLDMNYAPIGTRYQDWDSRTTPNKYQGNYFIADAPEGFVVPMAWNEFKYPHSSMTLEGMLKAA